MTKATNTSTNTKEKASPPSKEKKEKKESQEKKSFFQRWMQFHFSSKKYFSEVLQGEVFPAKYLFFFFLGISFCFFATISFILFYNEMELSNILSILLLIVLAFTGIIFLPLFLEFLLCRSLGGLQSFRKYLLCWEHFLFFIFLDLFFFGVLFVLNIFLPSYLSTIFALFFVILSLVFRILVLFLRVKMIMTINNFGAWKAIIIFLITFIFIFFLSLLFMGILASVQGNIFEVL